MGSGRQQVLLSTGDEPLKPGWGRLPRTYRILERVSDAAIPLLAILAGIVGIAAGAVLVRASGADTATGRRLAGARAIPLGEVVSRSAEDRLPTEAVRLEGRVRCADPIRTADGDRLAARHRDVEVRLPDGTWRRIERLREARVIDLWERTASIRLDLAAVAEPIITIPHVWEGTAAELGPDYRGAVERVVTEAGMPTGARAVTRQVTLVDQLIVLAHVSRGPDGRPRLDLPGGGMLVSTVDLDTAMRLLAGPNRTPMLVGYAVAVVGLIVALGGAIGTLVVLLT